MQLDKKNYEFFAFNAYTNKSCFSKKEFSEDLKKAQYAKKLARKIADGKDVNIRLLLNHVILFTNVFELQAAKDMLLFNCTDIEKSIFKTVFLFLGFITKSEYTDIEYHLETAKMLKKERI